MNPLRRIFNLVFIQGWSFEIKSFNLSRSLVRLGESLSFNGIIANNGFRIGTVYVQFQLSDPYDHSRVPFDSHTDFSMEKRLQLRVVDVRCRETSGFTAPWTVPLSFPPGVYDVRCILWSVPKLFEKTQGFILDSTGWRGGFEVVREGIRPFSHGSGQESDKGVPRPTTFISYSWDSEQHKEWVLRLAEELVRNGVKVMLDRWDLHAGEDIYQFMERGCRDNRKVIIVVTENYALKANKREGGVGVETVINASMYAKSKDKRRFIPVVRHASPSGGVQLPTYLSSALFIDMHGGGWRGKPFIDLLRAIYGEDEFVPPPIGEKPDLQPPP